MSGAMFRPTNGLYGWDGASFSIGARGSGQLISSVGFASSFRGAFYVNELGWRGINGKYNRLGWGGNGFTGARSQALRIASGARLAGNIALVGSLAISSYDFRSAKQRNDISGMRKAGVDAGMALLGLAWPVGTLASFSYFAVDAANGGQWVRK